MPTAITHTPAFTLPASITTDNAAALWTDVNTLGQSTIILDSGGNGRIGIAADLDLLALASGALTVSGTIGSGAITSTGVVTATGFTIGSATINEAQLEILDGATVSTAELNLLDGVTGLVQADFTKLAAIDATAAEIDLLDALDRGSIIYGNASSVTTVLGQGAADTVLTSDGNDISWQAPAAGGGPPQGVWATDFSGHKTRFVCVVTNCGTNTFAHYGMRVLAPQTYNNSGSSAAMNWKISYSDANGLHGGCPSLVVGVERWTGQNGAGSLYFGIGAVTVNAAGHTFTTDHVGWKGIKTTTDTFLFATQGDGTTETASSSLFEMGNGNLKTMYLNINGTSSVDYYSRAANSSISSATNLTNNMMDTALSEIQFSVSANGVNAAHGFFVGFASYLR